MLEKLPEKPLDVTVYKEDDGRIVFSKEGNVFMYLLDPVPAAVNEPVSKILAESARKERSRIDVSGIKLGEFKQLGDSVRSLEDELRSSESKVTSLRSFVSTRLQEAEEERWRIKEYAFWNGMLSTTSPVDLSLVVWAEDSGRRISFSRVDISSGPKRTLYHTDPDARFFASVLKASEKKEEARKLTA